MHGDDPLPVGLPDRLREGCCKLAGSLQTATEQLSRDLGQRWHSIASDSGHVLRTLAEAPGRAAQAHARHLQQQPLSPAFAVITHPTPLPSLCVGGPGPSMLFPR